MDGYTRIPNELMRNPNLPPIAKVAWSVIASISQDYRATMAMYCEMAACHPDTWRATVKMLESFGMITVEHRPNSVYYAVVEDVSKWNIKPCEGMKNSEGTKISHPMKNSYPMKISEGMKNSEGEGMKISHPIRRTIKEQEKKKKILSKDNIKEKEEKGFVAPEFAQAFSVWMEYKRQRRESYKSDMSLKACYNKLVKLAGGDPDTAMQIIEQSMANNWAGLFELKQYNSNGNNQKQGHTISTRDKLAQDAVKAMAALAEESGRTDEPPF